MVVFLSDGLLEVKPAFAGSPAARFFNIAIRLHMDLQMLLCNRAFGSGKAVVFTSHSEFALRCLAKPFKWQSE